MESELKLTAWLGFPAYQSPKSSIEDIKEVIEVKTIAELSALADEKIFKDFSCLIDPKSWEGVNFRIMWKGLQIRLLLPLVRWEKVSHGKLQIKLYDQKTAQFQGYLNANVYPQSKKIKFSGMQKSDFATQKQVGETLLRTYLEVVKQFSCDGASINYFETDAQTKLDVAYLLKKVGFESKRQSPWNKFEIYKKEGQWYYYTTSTNKHKGKTAGNYTRLDIYPDASFEHKATVFIGAQVKYVLSSDHI